MSEIGNPGADGTARGGSERDHAGRLIGSDNTGDEVPKQYGHRPSLLAEDGAMTAALVRFPPHRLAAILVLAADDGWIVVAPRGHGWLHGDRDAALDDAKWLGNNWQLPVREAAS